MMSRTGAPSIFRALVFGLNLLLLSSFAPSALAGSDKPNPEALSQSAAAARKQMDVVQGEVNTVLAKIAKDPNFAQKLDAAVGAKNEKEIIGLLLQPRSSATWRAYGPAQGSAVFSEVRA